VQKKKLGIRLSSYVIIKKEERAMETVKTILVVDDEPLIRKLVKDFLKKENYTVLEAERGKEALTVFEDHPEINLVILDIMLPDFDGWTICRNIRKTSQVPVIMLTARAEEFDELLGFEVGADDYITKPFKPSVLVARVSALLKRSYGIDQDLDFGRLKIDAKGRIVLIDDSPIDLSPKEYELLLYFIENKNQAISREQLLDGIWGYDYFGDLRTVDTHINRLRIKLKDVSKHIQTVRGYGYRFEEMIGRNNEENN